MTDDKSQELLAELKSLVAMPFESEDPEINKFYAQHYDELANVYRNGYRHRYTELSMFLAEQSPDVYSSLNNWLAEISNYGNNEHPENENINKSILKLYDHIDLECIRLDRMEAVKCVGKETRDIYTKTHEDVEKAAEKAAEAEKSISKYHEQSIAVLSIFSAVVLTFMGGLSFTGAVLENFAEVSMFRLLLTIIFLGFILFNTLFILLRFVLYVIRANTVSRRFKSGIALFNAALIVSLLILIGVYAMGNGHIVEQWGKSKEATVSSITEME